MPRSYCPRVVKLLPAPILERGRGYRRERLNFRDTTCAFTAAGSGLVSFTVPAATGRRSTLCQHRGERTDGLLDSGAYRGGQLRRAAAETDGTVSKLLIGDLPALPPEPLPPLVNVLDGALHQLSRVDPPGPLQHCWSKTDQRWRSHEDGQPFAPFTTSVEHRALYLGFNPLDPDPLKARVAFPPNTWIELYLDVEETGDEVILSRVLWEYWNGAQWQELATVDETRGLWTRGTLGFFGPQDHQPAYEFGKRAYWLRVSPQESYGPSGA